MDLTNNKTKSLAELKKKKVNPIWYSYAYNPESALTIIEYTMSKYFNA